MKTYNELYQEKMLGAAWYKKPVARNFFKAAGIVTALACVVLASMSAYMLSHPLSRAGTTGHHLLGSQGLTAVKACGFTGSVLVSGGLIVYLRKSVFRVADYVTENKGFLYKITDSEQRFKGYLFGTIHSMPRNWVGLNAQTKSAIDQCGAIVTETELPLPRDPCVDFAVVQYAKEKQYRCLEDGKELQKYYEQVRRPLIWDMLRTHNLTTLFTMGAVDQLRVAWQRGDEQCMQSLYGDVSNENVKSALKRFNEAIIQKRNEAWVRVF